MYKSRQQIERENKFYKVIAMVSFGMLISTWCFMVYMTDGISDDYDAYENNVSIVKAQYDLCYDELLDIKRSGTCLGRISSLER